MNSPVQPIAWWPLGAIAVLHVLLHVGTNGNFGIFRDEYYYLACAARPAWGYVDHPPISIWVLSVWVATRCTRSACCRRCAARLWCC